MPKLTEKITDRVMRDLPAPTAGNVLFYDPELSGFAARVTAAGARSFVLVYRFAGSERRDTVGQFPAWSAKAAREIAKAWRRDVDLGIDPRGAPEPELTDKTLFLPLAEQFLAHGKTKRGRTLRPAMLREYRRALISYAEPLHGMAVDQVHRSDAAELIRNIATKHGTTTAMRFRAAGSRFFGWLIAGNCPKSVADNLQNPFTGTEGYETSKRSRVLNDAEIEALWMATAEPGDFNLVVRICLWCGVRRSEAGGMRSSELENDVWVIPEERSKNHRPLALPMSRQMREALEAWQPRPGRDHLFGQGANGFVGWSAAKARLDARLGFAKPWSLHDLRRTVQTRMRGLGIPKDDVNRTLNHAMGPIDETYDLHEYLPEKREALRKWADEIDRISPEPTENVLKLRRPVAA